MFDLIIAFTTGIVTAAPGVWFYRRLYREAHKDWLTIKGFLDSTSDHLKWTRAELLTLKAAQQRGAALLTTADTW